MSVLAVLAGSSYDPSAVKPGVLALLVVVALAVATFFLIRSMLKQIRKINVDDSGDEAEVEAEKRAGEDNADGEPNRRV